MNIKNKSKLILVILMVLMIPQMAFASWWNPFSWTIWKIFNKKDISIENIQQKVNADTEDVSIKKDITQEIKKENTHEAEEKEIIALREKVKILKEEISKKDEEDSLPQTKNNSGTKTFTLQSGAVIDENGNLITPAPIKQSNTITPPDSPIFMVQAKDETVWTGFTKEEAQAKADQHMISIDTFPPRIRLQKMIDSWSANSLIIKNDNSVYGTMGIWVDNIFEDLQPGLKPGSGMGKAEYYIDDVLLETVTAFGSSGPGKISWDTTKYTDGEHKIIVRGYDKAGNISTDSVNVMLKNN